MIEELTPTQFRERLGAGEPWQLLDVREAWEIEIAAVADAIGIPMPEIPARYGELDTASPVAVLCHTGGRSLQVASFLAANGFAQVANITGGIDAWSLEADTSIPRY